VIRKCVSHASNSQDINLQSLHNVRASPICCNRAKTATVQKRTGARPTHVRTLYVTYSVCMPSVQSANPTPQTTARPKPIGEEPGSQPQVKDTASPDQCETKYNRRDSCVSDTFRFGLTSVFGGLRGHARPQQF
jgi:hypothetical protein